jgi:hypothetical protein
MLVELFKGKTGIEDRSDKYHEPLASYFERVLSCQWLNPETRRMEDRSNVVIPNRSIIEFYLKELHITEGPVMRVAQPARRKVDIGRARDARNSMRLMPKGSMNIGSVGKRSRCIRNQVCKRCHPASGTRRDTGSICSQR